MKQLTTNKYSWAILLVAFIVIIYASLFITYRVDLTAEKRFSLTNSSQKLISNLKDPITIDVYLSGKLASGLRKVSNSVDESLQQYRSLAKGTISINYIDPFAITDDSLRATLLDSLKRYGLTPFTQVAQEKMAGATETDRNFYESKVATSKFFCQNVLPNVTLMRKLIEAGNLDLMDLKEEHF